MRAGGGFFRSARRRERAANLGASLVLLLGAVTMVMPFVWMVSTSLKSSEAAFEYPPRLVPQAPTLDSYLKAWRMAPFGRYFLNSSIVSITVTVSQVFFCSLAAYVFAKHAFWGKRVLFTLVLAKLMIPFQVVVVPLFAMVIRLKLADTLRGVILPDIMGAFGIFMLHQFVLGIPDELIDSARIDACTGIGIYRRIVVPLIVPALSIFAIITFMDTWSEFLWPLIVINSPRKMTLPLGLAVFSDVYVQENNLKMAASLIVLLPVVVVFSIFQRRIIESIASSGLKEG